LIEDEAGFDAHSWFTTTPVVASTER
jgi:hypothetical protein